MTAKSWLVTATAVLIAACGCDTKPIGSGAGGGGKSAPSRELDTISHMGPNQAPVVDPMGSVPILKGAKHQVGCENNLRQVGELLQVYILSGKDYPAPGQFFRALIESGTCQDINVCGPPKANLTRDEVLMQAGEKAYKVTMDRLSDSTSPDKPIVWDPVAFLDGRHYLVLDGSVHFATEEQFQALMTKWEGAK